jgi:hypothetical protein
VEDRKEDEFCFNSSNKTFIWHERSFSMPLLLLLPLQNFSTQVFQRKFGGAMF